MSFIAGPPSLRDFWIELLPLYKLYALYLGGVTIYIVLSLTRILVRFRSSKNQTAVEVNQKPYSWLTLLRNKTDNLRQLIFFSILLFGLVFFLQIPAHFRSLVDSSLTGWDFIFRCLTIYFSFATDVLFVLLFLHSAQWFVSARICAAEIRLTLPH